MGQSWILVNLDKREKHEFWKLGERCENFKIHERLSGSKFKVYSAADYIDQAEQQQKVDEERAARSRARGWSRTPVVAKVYRRVEQRQSAFLTKLPVEVISLCVCSMDTLQDKACFALTCQDAWDIARLRIFKDIIAHKSWERDRILCIGDYTRIDDIPPNVFNDEELAVLRDIETTKGQPPLDAESSNRDRKIIRMTDFLDARGFVPFSSEVNDVRKWLKQHCDGSIWADHRPSFLWFSMVEETGCYVLAAETVLRNLTTHEYIRGDAYLDARARDPQRLSPIHFWGLADILLLRIAWAPDSDGCWDAMMKQTDPHGAWAGQRFDLVDEDDLPCDEEGEVLPPWKDVSDEFINDVLRCRGWGPYRPLYPYC